MSLDHDNASRGSVPRTLGIVVTDRPIFRSVAEGAGFVPPSEHAAGLTSFAGCLDVGVLKIGLRGGRALYTNEQNGPAQEQDGLELGAKYRGTAEAIARHLDLIGDLAPARVLVQVGEPAGDLDYRALLLAHVGGRFGATAGCVEVPADVAHRFAVLGLDGRGRVARWANEPTRPQQLPNDPTRALVAVDAYVFDLECLVDGSRIDDADPGSTRDLRRDLLPLLVRAGDVGAHVFRDAAVVSRYAAR